MSLITGKGNDINFGGNVDLKTVFIRLKDKDSVKVRVLGLTDYVEYKAHSSFEHKVYTQPCVAPLGEECPNCVASKSGVEGFEGLYARKRYVFAFADLDKGQIRVWDCSKNQAKDLIAQIEEYADDINDIAFNFKRTGNKTDTSYKLNPILKMKGDDQEKFNAFDGVEVNMEFFESVLVPRTRDLMIKVLDEAGFPVKEYFPDYTPEGEEAPTNNTPPADDVDPAF